MFRNFGEKHAKRVFSKTKMMSDLFGKRLQEIRKEKALSQDALAKELGVHGAVIGRYERGEVRPSIEMASKIAEALGVSLDYLVGNSDLLLDRSMIQRIQDVQKLEKEQREHAMAMLDAFIQSNKVKKAVSS